MESKLFVVNETLDGQLHETLPKNKRNNQNNNNIAVLCKKSK